LEFTSVIFLEVFLPVVLALYWLLGLVKKETLRYALRNSLLLLTSILFYAWGGIRELGMFAGIILVNYASGFYIERNRECGKKVYAKTIMIVSIVLDALILGIFKYFNMILSLADVVASGENVGSALLNFTGSTESGAKILIMPLAISFIVFQSISYVADVYNEKVKAEKNPAYFALYMSFFAQLTQGPIMRYGVLGTQLRKRTHSFEKMKRGIKRFCYGIGKKILIANTVATQADNIFNTEKLSNLSSGIAWLGILLYTLQIYYDFSGYTDMAIGIGMMFGFDITENFDYPYTSLSIQEFWRRWHISLSTWFKDYVYIPLGGNRCSKARLFFNLSVVFFVTGIWHGANLTFILWGLLFAVFSVLERAFLGDLLKKNPIKPINWIYTTFVVMMGWVLFRSSTLSRAFEYFRLLFSFSPSPEGKTILSYIGAELIIAVIIGIAFAGFVQRPLAKYKEKLEKNPVWETVTLLFCIAVLGWCLVQVVGGSYNPSIYGNF